MGLTDVTGQTRAIDALKSALAGGSVHHAYLFGGPEGVGKELAAVGFAQALGCKEEPQNGCGKCSHCVRVAKRNHPDVMWILPEEEQVARKLAGRSDFAGTPSRAIKVEQIRKLQERLALRSLEGGKKVAIIGSAHAMNEPAQNAFLKTLEEPPPETVLILIASAADELLPTLRSRCAKVHFGALPVDFVASFVQKERRLDVETARLVAVMGGGSLSRALYVNTERLARRRELIERFESLPGNDARPILRFSEDFGGARDDAEDALRILQLWTRDLALVKADGGFLANQDLLPLAQEVSGRLSEGALHRRHELIEEARVALTKNGSPRLQLERLLILLGAGSGARA